jgi:alginate O-acetyltransferase complex protein AlgI
MLFTTPTFLIFLVVVFGLYWAVPHRLWQNGVILVASLVFYGSWDWRYLLLLLLIAGTDFLVARGMTAASPTRKRVLLGISLATNLGALGFFKYFNFFSSNLHDLLSLAGFQADLFTLRVLLPVGISFYTFQALSYTIDVYRGRIRAIDNVVEYFCFITFFPHMVAGPIQQATHLLVQFDKQRRFDWDHAVDGLRQMLWGFFKKMVIADNLGIYVTQAYGDVAQATGWELLWATYLFAFQIYCDFSGYTDIAIGCARLFSLHMTKNFAYPYFSTNIKDFWRRWHISLSTWFREYLYIPLGGNRLGPRWTALNAFIVFVVSGFWHGANWTFVIWGALHGLYFLLYTQWIEKRHTRHGSDRPSAARLGRLGAMLVTFHLVCLAWVFFRADDAPTAFAILGKIAGAPLTGSFEGPTLKTLEWIGVLVAVEWLQRSQEHGLAIGQMPRRVRWALYYALVYVIFDFCYLDYAPFIYFQF